MVHPRGEGLAVELKAASPLHYIHSQKTENGQNVGPGYETQGPGPVIYFLCSDSTS